MGHLEPLAPPNGKQLKLDAKVATPRVDDVRFIDHKIERSSGLAAFDQAVERAIKLCGRVGPPHDAIRDAMREDGIEIEFQPK